MAYVITVCMYVCMKPEGDVFPRSFCGDLPPNAVAPAGENLNDLIGLLKQATLISSLPFDILRHLNCYPHTFEKLYK